METKHCAPAFKVGDRVVAKRERGRGAGRIVFLNGGCEDDAHLVEHDKPFPEGHNGNDYAVCAPSRGW